VKASEKTSFLFGCSEAFGWSAGCGSLLLGQLFSFPRPAKRQPMLLRYPAWNVLAANTYTGCLMRSAIVKQKLGGLWMAF